MKNTQLGTYHVFAIVKIEIDKKRILRYVEQINK